MSELNTLIENLYADYLTAASQGTAPDVTHVEAGAMSAATQAEVERLSATYAEMLEVLGDEADSLEEVLPGTAPDAAAMQLIVTQWQKLRQSIDGLSQHIESLEQDIRTMQPWGDFDVSKVERLRQWGCPLRFWTLRSDRFAQLPTQHPEGLRLHMVADDGETAYFVTLGMIPTGFLPPDVRAVELCPSPVSTLIMLQTRDRDSLKRLTTLQGDFALAHCTEVQCALRQLLPADTPLPQTPHRFRPRHVLNWLKKAKRKNE